MDSAVRVEWVGSGFTLQEAPTPTGGWTDLAGTAATNQFIVSPTNGGGYYRLRGQP